MHSYHFPMASVAATVAIFNDVGNVLIGKRHARARAYPHCWGLPGGFLDPKHEGFAGETIEQCALREVFEETGITLQLADLNLFDVNSDPELDPRGQVVNICYYVNLIGTPESKAGDDLVELKWIDPEEAHSGKYEMAFNHGYEIIPKAVDASYGEYHG